MASDLADTAGQGRGYVTAVLGVLAALLSWARTRAVASNDAIAWLREQNDELIVRIDSLEEQAAYDKARTNAQQELFRQMRDRQQDVMEKCNSLSMRLGEPEPYAAADWDYHRPFAAIEEAGRAAVIHVRSERAERERLRRERAEHAKRYR